MRTYFANHIDALVNAYQQLCRDPLTTFFTVLVLGVALTLPSAFLVVLKNTLRLVEKWDKGTTVSVYLKADINSSQAQSLLTEINKNFVLLKSTYISPEEGLKEFLKVSALGDGFTLLNRNPLPGVIQLVPQTIRVSELDNLQSWLSQRSEVQEVKCDVKWVNRLSALLNLLEYFIYGLLSVLSIAMILIIGNTIRSIIQMHQAEIDVLKLIGATKAFIRRPFLYMGLLFGLLAGVICVLMIGGFFALLSGPVNHLAALYESQFALENLSLVETGYLVGLAMLLGFIGSWLALSRHLLEAEIH